MKSIVLNRIYYAIDDDVFDHIESLKEKIKEDKETIAAYDKSIRSFNKKYDMAVDKIKGCLGFLENAYVEAD